MTAKRFENVTDYIAKAPALSRAHLEILRDLFLSIPGIEETISYNVPYYKYHGEVGGFSVFAKHVSFGYGAGILTEKQTKQLQDDGYKLGKGTMQIRFDQVVPKHLVKEILNHKVKLNMENS